MLMPKFLQCLKNFEVSPFRVYNTLNWTPLFGLVVYCRISSVVGVSPGSEVNHVKCCKSNKYVYNPRNYAPSSENRSYEIKVEEADKTPV